MVKFKDEAQIMTPKTDEDDISHPVEVTVSDEPAPAAEPQPQLETSTFAQQLQQLNDADVQRRQVQQQQYAAYQEQLAEQQREKEQAEYDSLVNAVSAKHFESDNYRSELSQAWARGDWDAAAEAQTHISRIQAELHDLETGADNLGRADEPQPQYQQPQQYRDVHDYIERAPNFQNLRASERSMLHQYPQLVSAENMQRLGQYYEETRQQGIQRGSAEYFQYISSRFQGQQPTQATEAEQPIEQPKPSRQPNRQVSAPVSRASTDVKTGRQQETGGKVTLTPQQREAARFSGVSEQVYAKGLQRLMQAKRDGRYNEG
jgi:hypothetical protein